MKCIYCSTNSALRERSDGACKKCHHPFAFEPNTMMKLPFDEPSGRMNVFALTDPAFHRAIENVSDKHSVFFTPRQLYYQLLKLKSRHPKLKGKNANLVRPSGLKMKAIISYNYFRQHMLPYWLKAHGAPPKMLPEGGRLRPALQQGSNPPDLQSYSFDRLLVCDKAETADMLLANNLHFETNTPIVSLDGYPQDIFPNIMSMVRRNPNLKVFALHDADPQGCLLPLRLREDPRWFPQPSIQIFDIGLRPRHVAALPGLLVTDRAVQIDSPMTLNSKEYVQLVGIGRKKWRQQREASRQRLELRPEARRLLSPAERRWLESGYQAELASLKPSALMRAIYQSFNRAAEEEARLREMADHDPRGFFQTQLPGVPLALAPVPPHIVQPLPPRPPMADQPAVPPDQRPTTLMPSDQRPPRPPQPPPVPVQRPPAVPPPQPVAPPPARAPQQQPLPMPPQSAPPPPVASPPEQPPPPSSWPEPPGWQKPKGGQ